MKATRVAPIVAALVLMAPLPAAGQQEEAGIAPEQRVRLTSSELGLDRAVGRLVQLTADTVTIAMEGRSHPVGVPLSSVSRFEISQGRKSATATGAFTGLLGGAVLGLAIGSSACEEGFVFTAEQCVLISGGLGAAGGLLIGTITGAMIRTERWQEIGLDELRIDISPVAGDGVAVSASVRL